MQIQPQLRQPNLSGPRNGAQISAEASPLAADGFTPGLSADFDSNLERLRKNPPSPARLPNYSEPISNTDVDQTGFQNRLIEQLGPQFARMQFTHDCSKLQGMVPTQSQLQAEFDKLAADKSVPFEYIKDGCYARAHIMCDQMTQDQINNSKMFVMLENPYGPGKLTAENKYMQARWWYHVAPMVFAVDEKSKQVEPFIMDPSMAPRPLKPEEWIHAMWDEKTRIKIDVVHNPQYGPLESGGPNETFEESMPHARETCAEYSAELEKIKQEYDQTHPPQSKAA